VASSSGAGNTWQVVPTVVDFEADVTLEVDSHGYRRESQPSWGRVSPPPGLDVQEIEVAWTRRHLAGPYSSCLAPTTHNLGWREEDCLSDRQRWLGPLAVGSSFPVEVGYLSAHDSGVRLAPTRWQEAGADLGHRVLDHTGEGHGGVEVAPRSPSGGCSAAVKLKRSGSCPQCPRQQR
jgi:hypothetical protein